MEPQGPRQVFRCRLQHRAPARIPLAARIDRDQLAHDIYPGGIGIATIAAPRTMAQHQGAQCCPPRQGRRGDRRLAYAPSSSGYPACLVSLLHLLEARASDAGWSRDRIVAEINSAGVACFSGSCSEIYREKAFVDLNMGPDRRLPNARELGETSFAFLVDPALDTAAVGRAAQVLRDVMARASSTRDAGRAVRTS